jgi:hypothetical protein
VNSEQKRHLQRQPFLCAARRGFSGVAATFASQINPTGISQIHLVFLDPTQKQALSCPETDLTEPVAPFCRIRKRFRSLFYRIF